MDRIRAKLCTSKKRNVIENLRMVGLFFIGVISQGRVVVPSPKIVINLPRSYNVKENHTWTARQIQRSCYIYKMNQLGEDFKAFLHLAL